MKKTIRVAKTFKIVKRPCSLNRYYRVKDKSPKDSEFWSLPSSSGHLEVCKLFLEACFEDGVKTPFQLAAWNGHLSVINERQNIPLREEYQEI